MNQECWECGEEIPPGHGHDCHSCGEPLCGKRRCEDSHRCGYLDRP